MQSISLSKILFSYPGADDLFSDLSAVFNNQSHVAIIGDNGCGKTTLLKIIANQIEPTDGQIVRNASVYLSPQTSSPDTHSGGERQQRELARAFASNADILLLDEPTNNLDLNARQKFFEQLWSWHGGAVIISHDRELLNQMDTIMELSKTGIKTYGGNYDFYVAARNAERSRLESEYIDADKKIGRLNQTMKIAEDTKNTHAKKQKKDLANRKKDKNCANKTGLAQLSETTASKRKRIIQKKLDDQLTKRQEISAALRDDQIKIPLPAKPFHKNDLITISDMAFGYDWSIFHNFNFQMHGGERIRISGDNGSGKTTLLKLILGQLQPQSGYIKLSGHAAYLDQDLSLLDPVKSVVDNIMDFAGLPINQAFAIAANFGFRGRTAQKLVGVLSGGELLKATLAAVLGAADQPDLLILDEPTNNLDIKSIEILEDALNQYQGTILLISHDEMFVKALEIDRNICL